MLHTHMPYASALCCVERFELAMCHQNSLRFADDIAYDPAFNGLVLDNTEHARVLTKILNECTLLLRTRRECI